MIRTQIQLTDQQARRLRAAARRAGVSMAEMVRRCIDLALVHDQPDRVALYARAAGLVGAFDDREAATDLSAEHDRYLAEAFD
jgi:hypothetical protein